MERSRIVIFFCILEFYINGIIPYVSFQHNLSKIYLD